MSVTRSLKVSPEFQHAMTYALQVMYRYRAELQSKLAATELELSLLPSSPEREAWAEQYDPSGGQGG